MLKYHKTTLLSRIRNKIRYNLVIQSIRNHLAKIGFEFTPYYLFQEQVNVNELPEIPGNIKDYSVEFLGEEDIKIIGNKARGYSETGFLTNLKSGKKCLGVKYKGEILAFLWIDFNECYFPPNKYKLKKNEAYLYLLYTMEQYRGNNIASYLKYQTYKFLKESGKDTLYSITEYFNTSALKYKKKMNPKKLKFVLFIKLFKKYQWTFNLKTYE